MYSIFYKVPNDMCNIYTYHSYFVTTLCVAILPEISQLRRVLHLDQTMHLDNILVYSAFGLNALPTN